MAFQPILSALSTHDVEVAETLIGVINFLLIFVAARTLAEVLVRLQLPTIVGELLAGVLIGASGFHLLMPPSTSAQLNEGFVKIPSFGKFKITQKNQRQGRNPKTKEPAIISSKTKNTQMQNIRVCFKNPVSRSFFSLLMTTL